MNKEQLRMQMLAGIITEGQYKRRLNENEATKYFVVIIMEGDSDEIGNMKGIVASNQGEFEQEFTSIYGSQDLDALKKNPNDIYWTFYEVSSQEEMNKIVQMSEDWYKGDDSGEEELMSIAKKGKPFSQISF